MFNVSNQEEALYMEILADFMAIFNNKRPVPKDLVKMSFVLKPYDVRYGVSKVVLIPKEPSRFVIKIPMGYERGKDWCHEETLVYDLVKNAGCEEYFAAEEKYFENSEWPVYLQVRVEPFDSDKAPESNLTPIDYEDAQNLEMDDEVADAFAAYYSEETFRELLKFLDEVGIYDLHSGNVGYYKGAPVFIDYSGC